MKTLRDESKHSWDGLGTFESINSGSLQRIADACELMAKDRERLESDFGRVKRNAELYHELCLRAERRNAALRGVITKLKKKIKELAERRNAALRGVITKLKKKKIKELEEKGG